MAATVSTIDTGSSSARACGRRVGAAFGALGIVAVLTACQAQPAAAPAVVAAAVPAAAAGDERALLERLRAEVGDAACTSDADCRTLGVGAKACGGPAYWLAWSTARASAERLQPLAAELAALQRSRQQREGLASDCRYVADPGAQCRAARCVLRSGGGVNPPASR